MKKIIVLILSFLFFGCNHVTGVNNAQLEQASADINNQNYNQAILILNSLDQSNPQVKSLLAAAYAGRAGFNGLKLADLIITNSQTPMNILYSLNTQYSASNITDIETALAFVPNDGQLNDRIQYASIEIYKISQLILKNYNTDFNTWNPCVDAGFLADDIINIIISINISAEKVKDVQQSFYDYITKLESQLNINPTIVTSNQITDQDITNFRNALIQQINSYSNGQLQICN